LKEIVMRKNICLILIFAFLLALMASQIEGQSTKPATAPATQPHRWQGTVKYRVEGKTLELGWHWYYPDNVPRRGEIIRLGDGRSYEIVGIERTLTPDVVEDGAATLGLGEVVVICRRK
jgi:hypothetical protein